MLRNNADDRRCSYFELGLPVMEHRVSDDEFYSDESGSSQEDSYEPTTDEGTDEELDEDIEEQDWSEEINRREDVEFQEEVGITVGSENLQSCLHFFFTVYH